MKKKIRGEKIAPRGVAHSPFSRASGRNRKKWTRLAFTTVSWAPKELDLLSRNCGFDPRHAHMLVHIYVTGCTHVHEYIHIVDLFHCIFVTSPVSELCVLHSAAILLNIPLTGTGSAMVRCFRTFP